MGCKKNNSGKRKMACGGKVKKMACGGKVKKMANGGETKSTSLKESLKNMIAAANNNTNKARARKREDMKRKNAGMLMPRQLRGIAKKK